MTHPSLSLIIPCFNEQSRIANMWAGIDAFIKVWKGSLQIIIVNDGSTDTTLEKLIEEFSLVKVDYFYQEKNNKT